MRCAPNSSSSPFTFDSVIIAGGKRKRTNEREKKKRTNRRCKRTACLVRVGRSLLSLPSLIFCLPVRSQTTSKLLKKKLHTHLYSPHTPPAAFPIKKKREKKFSPRASPFSYKSPLCTHAHAHARIFVFVYGRRTSRLKRETQTFWRERIRVRKC